MACGPNTGVIRSVFNAWIRRFVSSAARSCFAALSGSFRSTIPSERKARRPISFTAFAAWSMWKYMSLKVVVPVLIISRHASFVPQNTSSGRSFASAGQIFVSSQVRLGAHRYSDDVTVGLDDRDVGACLDLRPRCLHVPRSSPDDGLRVPGRLGEGGTQRGIEGRRRMDEAIIIVCWDVPETDEI